MDSITFEKQENYVETNYPKGSLLVVIYNSCFQFVGKGVAYQYRNEDMEAASESFVSFVRDILIASMELCCGVVTTAMQTDGGDDEAAASSSTATAGSLYYCFMFYALALC